jgi:radical SAM-linked protein
VRVRIRFSKVGKVRFTSHRDVARMWERAFRRADIPVAYSEGFSPRPKLSFGLALSNGHESVAEYVDADLVGQIDLDTLGERTTVSLPEGLTVTGVTVVPPGTPSLQEDVVASRWHILLDGVSLEDARSAVAAALAAPTLVLLRTRKGEERSDDVRPAIAALSVEPTPDGPLLDATLATRPRGLRPTELLAVVLPNHPEPEFCWRQVLRVQQFIERDGSRRELPPLAAAPAPHALEPACA